MFTKETGDRQSGLQGMFEWIGGRSVIMWITMTEMIAARSGAASLVHLLALGRKP